jgi:GT2 family glycosyltransferase
MSLDVAVVVITYNSAKVIDNCLGSLDNVADIVVVDNGSTDGTCRAVSTRWSGAKLIANPENRGFAGAANQGAKATQCPLLLFLNPDAALLSGLGYLISEFDDSGVGAAAGRLVDGDGRTQVGFNVRAFPTCASLAFEALLINRLWPGNPANRRYRCLDLDYGRAQNVEQPAGAFLMVRRLVLEAVGGWDERFFPLWFEDVDLCRRIRSAGYSIRYTPAAVARHKGAHSIGSISEKEKQTYWYGSLLSYSDKHFSPLERCGVRAAVLAGAALRMAGSLLRSQGWQSYSRVMGMALRRPAKETRQVQPHALM